MAEFKIEPVKMPPFSDTDFGLSPDQIQLLKKFRDTMADACTDITTLVRFLVARKWKIEDAEKQLRNALKWRQENDVDNILNQPLEGGEVVKKLVGAAFQGHDKLGRPVYIERTGEINIMLLINLIPEKSNHKAHVWGQEFHQHRCRQSSVRLGKPVYQISVINDLTGLNDSHRKGLKFLKHLTQLDADMYPEMLGSLYIVNAPWIFPILWRIVRVWIDPRTREKIHVLGADYKTELLKHIDAQELPREYGGTSDFEVPHADYTGLHVESMDPPLTTTVISAGGKFEQTLESGALGLSASWFFRTVSKDVRFFVQWLPEGGSPEVVIDERIDASERRAQGSFVSEGRGRLVFLWDNTFSWTTSKTVKWHLEGIANTDAPEASVAE